MIATPGAGTTLGNRVYHYDNGGKYYINSKGQKVYSENQSFYVGYNSNSGPSVEINGFGINQNGPYINGNNVSVGTGRTVPHAYTANAAKTASSIKQGGMTKDEIMDFNIRHPNETMIRGQ